MGFSKAEELWAAELLHLWADGKGKLAGPGGKLNLLRQSAALLRRSETHYTLFLNHLRMSLFENMSRLAPDDPAALSDFAQTINIMTGRGHGDTANFLSQRQAGIVFFAPRYAWSDFQNSTFIPYFNATTKIGKQQAAKAYARQLAFMAGVISIAYASGQEIERDQIGRAHV